MKNFCEQLALDFLFGRDGKTYFLEMHQGPGGFDAYNRDDVPPSILTEREKYIKRHEEWFYNATPRKKRWEFPLRDLADNKYRTYTMFPEIQPPTFHLTQETQHEFYPWLEKTLCKFIIAKPLNCGSGVGIGCYHRKELVLKSIILDANQTPLIQKYIIPKLSKRGCVQCARQVVTVSCVEGNLYILLSVPYMREASEPFLQAPKKSAMVANIAQNGRYVETTDKEKNECYQLAPIIAVRAMSEVLGESLPADVTLVFPQSYLYDYQKEQPQEVLQAF